MRRSLFLFSPKKKQKPDLDVSYGLDNDDYAEELEEAQIPDTLEADNYEDQLPQQEVNLLFTIFYLKRKNQRT